MALLAALTIFSVAFAAGIEPGPVLDWCFRPCRSRSSICPSVRLLALLFFLLLAFAAPSSSISMLSVVAYMIDEKGWRRWRPPPGRPCRLSAQKWSACSFNRWRDHRTFWGRTFRRLRPVGPSYSLPLGGLLVALRVG
ncbi:MAG: hypothetical protein R2864_06360 [Syntrophotaleaceae bacterium]